MRSNTLLEHKIRKVFLKEDPLGIYFPESENTDEYDKEIHMLLSEITKSTTEKDLYERILSIFRKQFGEKDIAMRKQNVKSLSEKIWSLIR